MPADDTMGAGAETSFLRSMRELSILRSAHRDDPQRFREAAAQIVAQWSDPTGAARSATDITDRLGNITAEDAKLLGEGLRVITEWLRRPSEETGRRVDAVIERMRRELGPLVEPAPRNRKADQERLRASVRESIARRLSEARAKQRQQDPAE